MNKLVYKILLLAALPLLLWRCAESDVDRIRFDLDASEVTLRTGEAGSTDILIASNFAHPTATVSADAGDWLSAKVVQRCLTIIYTRNETDAERTGEVTVTAGSYVRTVTVTQPAWVAPREGYAVGDLIDEGLGVVYWVDPADARIAKAISVERVAEIAWSSTASTTDATSTTNGPKNMELLNSSTFTAAYHCAAMGEDWYLPALNELIEIFEIYNGTSYEEATNQTPSVLTEAEKAARAEFDSWLEAAGGSKMNTASDTENGNSYWSSTESDANNAWYVRFGKKDYSPGKKTNNRSLRCVKVLGNYSYAAEPVELTLSPETVTLEGAAQSKATSEATVRFGTLAAAEVESAAQSWLTATVTGSTVTVTALTDNTTGKTREATVTVTATPDDPEAAPATATLTVTQKPQLTEVKWKVGDVYPASGTPEGIIFWVSDDGQTAKVISMKRTEGGVKWTNAASPALLGATSETDGVANTTVLLASAEADDIEALKGCTDGWYWPSYQEMTDMNEVYMSTEYTTLFDNLLTTNGYPKLNASTTGSTSDIDRYWTSTETSEANALWRRIGNNNGKQDEKKTGGDDPSKPRYIRWMKQLGEGAQSPEKPSGSGPSEGGGK